MIPQEILQLGTLGAIFAMFIVQFFSYLKSKNGNGKSGMNEAIFQELQKMNTNHLHSIETAINQGNKDLIESIHNDNKQMIALLGEIKGLLSR